MIKQITIIIIIGLLSINSEANGQAKEWNLILDKETYEYSTDKVMETDSFYYVAGRAGIQNYGFSMSKISKRDGSTIAIVNYEENGVWLDFNQCNKWYIEGESLIFPMTKLSKPPYLINLFSINIHTLAVSKQMVLPIPDSTANYVIFLLDFKKIGDDYYILASYRKDNIQTKVIEGYPFLYKINIRENTYSTIMIPFDKDAPHTSPLRMVEMNGRIVVFGSEPNPNNYPGEGRMVIWSLSLDGELQWKYTTPKISPIYDVRDIYPLNEREVLLASEDDSFLWSDRYLWPRWVVTRFDIESQQIVWSTHWNEPRKKQFMNYAKIVPAKEAGTYLLMANDRFVDISCTMGKVVKFTESGDRLWQKQYYFEAERGTLNDFFDMIATTDGHYLIMGWTNAYREWKSEYGGFPWLVKIDEDGNIMPIDTTTKVDDTALKSDHHPNIEVYPNPATETLYIQINGDGITKSLSAIITGIDGKPVSEHRVAATQNAISLSGYQPGIYTVQVKDGSKQIYVTRFVKL
ncbi:MAG TPA: T9SS type A sorting domain-containing protein [Saprospiraceae bacterium]|jgi:hypothetical protein|nr:T9SS type A sorting domain-containing protein [Saprospiraceae bacterium]HRO08277.1 T9SS type A sorting domain-containing protein [Saprospiraceae bacterium]HRP41168.1 T9SS type A sorting domain-containing protein [Saprospiraceae bacterium]